MKKNYNFISKLSAAFLVTSLLFISMQTNAQLSVWSFDANANATPTTYNATAVGSPTYTAGKVNNALSLSGTGQYATTPFVFNPASSDFTVTAWVKYTGTINNSLSFSPVIVQQMDESPTNLGRGLLWLSSYSATTANSLKFATSIGGSATYGTSKVVANTWYMVSVTKAGTSVKIYVNGVLEATSTKTATTCAGGLLIGCNKSFATLWTGQIDELAVYNTALSASELTTMYGITTNAHQTNFNAYKIHTSAKSIVVQGVVSEVAVFDLSGASIQASKMAGTFRSKALNAGLYFVRVDGVTQKVLVK